jgi:hypothetical protein
MQVESRSSPDVTVLVHGTGSEALLPREHDGLRVVRQPRLQVAQRALNLFVLVTATELPDVSAFVSVANRRHQLRALFVRESTYPRWLPFWFERAGLRTLRNTLVHADADATLPRRVLSAWIHGVPNELIADASVVGSRLFLMSCALERVEVDFDLVPALKDIPRTQRTAFEIDEDGSYVHWPGPDIHVDLDAIRAAIDPEARSKADAFRATKDERYGAAMARLRVAMGLKQSDIKGMSDRHVRRIEKGEGATHEALRLIAEAHGMKLDQYLHEVAAMLAAEAPALGTTQPAEVSPKRRSDDE